MPTARASKESIEITADISADVEVYTIGSVWYVDVYDDGNNRMCDIKFRKEPTEAEIESIISLLKTRILEDAERLEEQGVEEDYITNIKELVAEAGISYEDVISMIKNYAIAKEAG
jgi:hypothetical protein